MAEQSPFDLQRFLQPGADEIVKFNAIGADPAPKPPLVPNPMQGALPLWMIPFAALAGMRVRPRIQAPANNNVRFPMLDSPQAVPRGGNPDNSQVGQLNALTAAEFRVYLDARSRGMAPAQAMQAAKGK